MYDISKCIKETSKVQDGPTDFNVTKYKKFADTVSDSQLQQTLRKLSLVKLCCTFKDYPQLTEMVIKIPLHMPTTYLCKAVLS